MPVTSSYRKVITRAQIPAYGVLDAVKALLSLDFAAHDLRLTQCLDSARETVEMYCGVLLTPCSVAVSYRELYDWEELPYGPVTNTPTATDMAGVTLSTPAVFSGGDFPTVIGTYPLGIALTYSSGYTLDTIPGGLREAWIKLAAQNFDTNSYNWQLAARPYRRITWAA